MEVNDENGSGAAAGAGGRPKRLTKTPAQAQAERNAKLAANAARRAAEAEAKRKAAANLKNVTGRLGGVTIPGDDLLASLLGAAANAPAQAYGMGAGAAAAAPPPKASAYLLSLKREYDEARKELEEITQNNRKEGEKGEYVTESVIGLGRRQEAIQRLIAAKAAVEAQYEAEGKPSLAGGGRRRRHRTKRAKKTKKSRRANRKSRRSRK